MYALNLYLLSNFDNEHGCESSKAWWKCWKQKFYFCNTLAETFYHCNRTCNNLILPGENIIYKYS